MKPHVLGIGVKVLTNGAEGTALALPHLTYLLVEKAQQGDAQQVDIDDDVVHETAEEK